MAKGLVLKKEEIKEYHAILKRYACTIPAHKTMKLETLRKRVIQFKASGFIRDMIVAKKLEELHDRIWEKHSSA